MNEVQNHYAHRDIVARILAALRAEHGDSVALSPDSLAPIDHFHGRGVLATEEMAAMLDPRADDRVLDIGSGIGGPARWIAARCGCHVTGIDLTPEFCAAAEALTAACGLARRVRIVQGSGLDLPFSEASFDAAFSQNVVMNIADKPRFYREAFRVLRPGGRFALTAIGAGAAGPPYYPTPWAASAGTSFLASLEDTDASLRAAGFEIVSCRDTTSVSVGAQTRQREAIRRDGPPQLGVHIVVGRAMLDYQRNVARGMEEGRLTTMEALARKPA
jgi:SAM-dependent methyltransferase